MRKPFSPLLVSLTGLVGLLGIAWLCDGLMEFLRYQNIRTFSLNYVILWIYPLVALLLATVWLLVAWMVLARLPRNAWVSLAYLLCGLFIVVYPALYYTPVLCCGLPDIAAIQLAPTSYFYSSGGCLAVIGLAGLVLRGKKRTASSGPAS
jgi:hypothetical protein